MILPSFPQSPAAKVVSSNICSVWSLTKRQNQGHANVNALEWSRQLSLSLFHLVLSPLTFLSYSRCECGWPCSFKIAFAQIFERLAPAIGQFATTSWTLLLFSLSYFILHSHLFMSKFVDDPLSTITMASPSPDKGIMFFVDGGLSCFGWDSLIKLVALRRDTGNVQWHSCLHFDKDHIFSFTPGPLTLEKRPRLLKFHSFNF